MARSASSTADGLLARCVQHEIDHLDGILFVDHLSALKRNMIMRKLIKTRRAACLNRPAPRGHGHDRLRAAEPRGAARRRPRRSPPSTPSRRAPPAAATSCAARPCTRRPSGWACEVRTPRTLQGRRGARPSSRPSAPTSPWSAPTACCCRVRSSTPRVSAASTCMPRCCRAGAAPRRSSARSWPATAETGISIFHMEEGLDTGPVYAMRPLPIGPATTAPELHERLAGAGRRDAAGGGRRASPPAALPAIAPARATASPTPASSPASEGRLDFAEPAGDDRAPAARAQPGARLLVRGRAASGWACSPAEVVAGTRRARAR